MEKTIDRICQQYFEVHKQAFINFIHSRFPFNGDEIMDLYLDVWTDIIDNVRRGRTEDVKNWKSYIFDLGWKRACKTVTRRHDTESYEVDNQCPAGCPAAWHGTDEDDAAHLKHLEDIEIMIDVLTSLPAHHRELLEHFYLEGMSTKEIAIVMGYAGQRAVITMKGRSVALLREKMKSVA